MMITIYILLRYNKIESFWMGYDHIFNKKKCNLYKYIIKVNLFEWDMITYLIKKSAI